MAWNEVGADVRLIINADCGILNVVLERCHNHVTCKKAGDMAVYWHESHSSSVREPTLHLYNQGRSTGEIATSLGYCLAAVRRVRQHFTARETLAPQTHQCGRKTLLSASRR